MRSSTDLFSIFAALPLPPGSSPAGRFSAQPVPGIPSCSVGKDLTGCPVLLIETQAVGPRDPVAPTVLENLSILHNVDCRLQSSNEPAATRRLSVIRCCGEDALLHEYFLRALPPVLAGLPPTPTREQVVNAISGLIELFRKTSQAPRKAVQGLWAELLVIETAENPSTVLRGWHSEPEDRFDFAEGSQRLEVKTASGRVRAHRFSLEQLRPPADVVVVVASALIERSAGGQSIADLVDRIRTRVNDPGLLVYLDSVIAQSLGSDWRAAQRERFDRQLAVESLRFFNAAAVPCVPAAIPTEVTDVHFRVDLTNHAPEPAASLRTLGRLFEAALPLG